MNRARNSAGVFRPTSYKKKTTREKAIDALIPKACKHADDLTTAFLGTVDEDDATHDAVWARYYHEAMNKLAHAKGLRTLVPNKKDLPFAKSVDAGS